MRLLIWAIRYRQSALRSLRPSIHLSRTRAVVYPTSLDRRMRHDTSNTSVKKYCAVCGRLISPHVRNFEERKYCSKSCSGTRLTELDRLIEDKFVTLSIERGQIDCGEVQALLKDEAPTKPDSAGAADEQTVKTRAGQNEAAFRERVRRAARRVVVNGRDDHRFICWSEGKAVEPSFAKGEWAVKHVQI